VRAEAPIPWAGVADRTPAGIRARDDLRSLDVLVPLLVGTGLALADLATPAFPGSGAFIVLLVPVVLCTVLLGTYRGFVALMLGAAGALALVPIRGHPWLSDPGDVARLVLYLMVGAGMIVAIGRIPRERHAPSAAAPMPATLTPPSSAIGAGTVESLTPRELDVLRLAARGSSTDEIADRLYVSRNTVKSHLAHAYGKLGAHNRAQAVAIGISEGLLDPEDLCGSD
jgi:DNA-binding CsgD family transcriptional regulator